MTVTKLNLAENRMHAAPEAETNHSAEEKAVQTAAGAAVPDTEPVQRDLPKEETEKKKKVKKTRQPAYPPSPEALRLQYNYELERSREISSSINRLTVLIPIMIFAVCFLIGTIAPLCTEHIAMDIFLILGVSDVVVLLGALVVACTVHFYILNPAPSQTEEFEWMTKMKRDLQRGNNWRAWLVFAATLLIYISAAITLAILILCLVGR